MENKYEEAEKIGRDLTIQILGSKVNLVELGIKDRADFSGSTINGDFILESKFRNINSDDFPNDDLFEVSKFEGLKALSNNTMQIFYLCIFKDNIARLHHITKLSAMDLNFGLTECDISTAHPELGKEWKMTIFLPNAKAKTLKYSNDRKKI